MKIKPFVANYPKVELITSPKSFFSNIKYQYIEYRENGIYDKLKEPGYYVYQVRIGQKNHLGVLTLTNISELKNDNILKHEKTLAAKEQNMMHLLLQRKALVKPVLLGFKSNKEINQILKKATKGKPLLSIPFKSDHELHTIWQLKNKVLVEALTDNFKKIKKAYIGDGHHRSSTVRLLNESKKLGKEAQKYDHLYTAYFPFDQLKICDFNRVVDITEIISIPEFIVDLSKYFEIEKLTKALKPQKKHNVTIYIDRKWYRLRWKAKYLRSSNKEVLLDAALINKYLFGRILGIEDVRVDTRIQYYGGNQPLDKIENSANRKERAVGICIYPISIKELTAISNLKHTLPPKSTWFLPRLKSGIIAKDL